MISPGATFHPQIDGSLCVSRAKAIIIVINQSDMEFRRVFVALIRVLLMSIRWGSDWLRPVGVRGRDVPEAHQ